MHHRSAIALLALTIAVAANGLTAEAASAADTAGDTSTQALVGRALDAVGQAQNRPLTGRHPTPWMSPSSRRRPAATSA
jgi:hypothetical protein